MAVFFECFWHVWWLVGLQIVLQNLRRNNFALSSELLELVLTHFPDEGEEEDPGDRELRLNLEDVVERVCCPRRPGPLQTLAYFLDHLFFSFFVFVWGKMSC